MTGHVNISGTWHQVANIYVNVSGVWRTVSNGYVNIGGTWREFYTAEVQEVFTSGSGTATNTYGATNLRIRAWGAGANGMDGFSDESGDYSGDGGGSGAYVEKTIAVANGDSVSWAVGTPTGVGFSPDASTVTGSVSGGSLAVSAGSGGSAPRPYFHGFASGGDTNTNGNDGGAGFTLNGGPPAGGAAVNGYGAGGTGGANDGVHSNSGTAGDGGRIELLWY